MANLEFYDTHNMVAYLNKLEGSEGFHQIVDFLNHSHIWYALTENPTIYVSLIQQFWQTATASTLDSGEIQITATIDGKVKIITEASIRRHLKLKDSDGISTLPTTKIFEQLALMGSPTQTPAADEAVSTSVDVKHGEAATIVSSLDAGQGSGNIDKTPTMPHDSPLLRVHTLGSDEGIMQHNKLIDLVTKLLDKVIALETDLRRANIMVSDDEDDAKYSSKQGRKIHKIDQDPDITLQRQERASYEAAVRLQEQLDEEERKRIARMYEESSSFNIEEWEDIQATIEVYEELAQRIQAEEREKYSEAKKARLLAELINQRKRYFAQQRAEERRNKPLIQAQ
ncbi:hypothetical protein Tco_1278565 [Tanacetum coccineum]